MKQRLLSWWQRARGVGHGYRRYDPGAPLYSIHVPKCGGTSVRANLAEWFGPRLHFHYADEASGRLPERHPGEPGGCVHGHFNRWRGFGVLDYYPDARQFITFLRDPFELHVSLYFYLKQHGASLNYAGTPVDLKRDFPSLRSFIEGMGADKEHPYAVSMLRYMPRELTRATYRRYLAEHFVHVGITEDLDNSLKLLARKLGRTPLPAPHLNVSSHDETMEMRGARQQHEVDFALEHDIYRHALEVHQREVRGL